MLDLTEMVKAMTLDEARAIALNAKEEYKKDPQTVVAALLKLQALESFIGDALKNASDELVKALKKTNGSLEASTAVKIKAPDGTVTPERLTVTVKSFDTNKTDIDFDALKADHGVVIEDDPDDPCVKHIRALDPGIFTLLKAPTIAGNPTAFEAAAATDATYGKYKTTKTVSKYAIAINLAVENN